MGADVGGATVVGGCVGATVVGASVGAGVAPGVGRGGRGRHHLKHMTYIIYNKPEAYINTLPKNKANTIRHQSTYLHSALPVKIRARRTAPETAFIMFDKLMMIKYR